MIVLLESYPKLFSERPDLSIYRDDIEFRALLPSGDTALIRGIDRYRTLFEALRLARQTTVSDADLSFNLSVSDCETRLRVRWHAELWLRGSGLLGLAVAPLRFDGVSVYELDERAKVRVHRLEYVERLSDRSQARTSCASLQPALALSPVA